MLTTLTVLTVLAILAAQEKEAEALAAGGKKRKAEEEVTSLLEQRPSSCMKRSFLRLNKGTRVISSLMPSTLLSSKMMSA